MGKSMTNFGLNLNEQRYENWPYGSWLNDYKIYTKNETKYKRTAKNQLKVDSNSKKLGENVKH